MPFVAPANNNPSCASFAYQGTPSGQTGLTAFKNKFFWGSTNLGRLYSIDKDLVVTQIDDYTQGGYGPTIAVASTGVAVVVADNGGELIRSTDGVNFAGVHTVTGSGSVASMAANDKGEMIVYFFRDTTGLNMAWSDDHGLTWTNATETTASSSYFGILPNLVNYSPSAGIFLLARNTNYIITSPSPQVITADGIGATVYGPMDAGKRIQTVGYLDGFIYWGDGDGKIWRVVDSDTSGASRELVGRVSDVDNNTVTPCGNVTIGDTIYFSAQCGVLVSIKNGEKGRVIFADTGDVDNDDADNSTYGIIEFSKNRLLCTRRGGLRIFNL